MDDALHEQWKRESALRFAREQIEQRERARELRVRNGRPPSEPSASPPSSPNQRDPFPSFCPASNTPLRTTTRKGSQYVSIGDRISYEGASCTVRYIGWVEGTEKGLTWFGVEWDDPSRGRHNGSHKGKVYFTCTLPKPPRDLYMSSVYILATHLSALFLSLAIQLVWCRIRNCQSHIA